MPFAFPTITVLLETATLEAVGHDDMDRIGSEADAVTSKVLFWLGGLGRRPGPARQESWYL